MQAQPCGCRTYCFGCYREKSKLGLRYITNCIRCAKNRDATTHRPYPGNCFVCSKHIADNLAAGWINETCGCNVTCSRECMAALVWLGPGCPICTKGGAPRYAPLCDTDPMDMGAFVVDGDDDAEEKEEKMDVDRAGDGIGRGAGDVEDTEGFDNLDLFALDWE